MSTADQEQAQQKRQGQIEDFKWLVADARGRRVLHRMLEQTRLFKVSHQGENTHATAFNEGARNIGLFLYGEIIEIAPEKMAEIMKGM